MREELEKKLKLFVENKQKVEKVCAVEYDLNYMIASLILTGKNKEADVEQIKEAREILASKEGVFSSFRSNIEMAVITKMALSGNPEGYIDDVLEVHSKIVGKRIIDYYSFILAAMTIVDFGKKSDADRIIAKSWDILARMKKEHPILADENDITFTILLAMTDKDVDTIINEMEQCYTYIKKELKVKADTNSIQSLCELIIMSDGDLTEKCDRAAAIFSAFKEQGMQYGSYYEFASLGALIGLDIDKDELVSTVIEVAEEMKKNKGFGIFHTDTRTRLMFAAMLVAQDITDNRSMLYDYTVNGVVISNSIAMIVAEEVAALICTMVIASYSDNYTTY
ncbi:MAG: DUF4003 family protein [Clostridiales bacterium]|nr:DUF4003 family protein [Clostridiales bacterium]